MDVFTIAMMHTTAAEAGILREMLAGHTEPLQLDARWEIGEYPGRLEIRCLNQGTSRWTAADRRKLFRETSRSLARYIADVAEEKLLRSLFAKDYGYTGAEEVERLLGFCRQMPEYAEPPRKNTAHTERFRLIAQEIEMCLKENNTVNLDGLLSFRLKEYRELLKETVDYAVDEYLMDKQYQEFISLLKYFVFIQQAKMPSVHLVHQGGREFLLLDEAMRPIETSSNESITVETLEKELNFEDLIVSTLITVAPAKIHIHTEHPELPVIKTIMQIFEERAELCRCSPGAAISRKPGSRKHSPG